MYKMPAAAAAFLFLSTTTSFADAMQPVQGSLLLDLQRETEGLSERTGKLEAKYEANRKTMLARVRAGVRTNSLHAKAINSLQKKVEANGRTSLGPAAKVGAALRKTSASNLRRFAQLDEEISGLQEDAATLSGRIAENNSANLQRFFQHAEEISKLQEDAASREENVEDAINRAKQKSNVAVAQAAKKETASKKLVGSVEGRINTALALGALRHHFSKDTSVSVAVSGGRQALGSTERPSFAAGVSAKMDNNTFVNFGVGSGLGDLSNAAMTFGASFSF